MPDNIIKDFTSLEPAIDPQNKISFLLDWEITMKCNLDCEYCPSGPNGSHDNTTSHPALADCIKTIDFMFEYADLYMATKTKGIKYVILNVYGGEALHHPNIVEILQEVRKKYQRYKDRWHLTVTNTTNAIVSEKKLQQIIPLIDEFTVSYHSHNTDKQKQQFKQNLLSIASAGKRQKCIVLIHSDPDLFNDCNQMIDWLNEHSIKHLPRQLDHEPDLVQFNYNPQQVKWFEQLYNKKSYNVEITIDNRNKETDLTEVGRACCGGRSLCTDQNYHSRSFWVDNKFTNWFCSVNHFFLFVKQLTGDVYTNKDCKMNFDGSVGAIGNLNNTGQLLEWTRTQLANKQMPVIQCKKYKCLCGLCAPKAQDRSTFDSIMKKYQNPAKQ